MRGGLVRRGFGGRGLDGALFVLLFGAGFLGSGFCGPCLFVAFDAGDVARLFGKRLAPGLLGFRG